MRSFAFSAAFCPACLTRLPAPTRNLLNQWLDDGFTYRDIIEKLKSVQPPVRYAISEMNLSNWFKGGYKDWTNRQLQEKIARQVSTPSPASATTCPSPCTSVAVNCTEMHQTAPTKG